MPVLKKIFAFFIESLNIISPNWITHWSLNRERNAQYDGTYKLYQALHVLIYLSKEMNK